MIRGVRYCVIPVSRRLAGRSRCLQQTSWSHIALDIQDMGSGVVEIPVGDELTRALWG